MSHFLKVFNYYNKPFRGFFYVPARWLIVPFEQIESYLPNRGTIIDIGCGEGIMSTLAALKSKKRVVIGIDKNTKKIKLAKQVGRKIRNLSFYQKDVMVDNLPKGDGFILSDFLHHLPVHSHKELFVKIFKSLNKGGVVIIKEIDLQDGIRAKVSRFFDFIFYPLQEVNFIHSKDLMDYFETLGANITVIKVKKWFPGSTTLFIVQK